MKKSSSENPSLMLALEALFFVGALGIGYIVAEQNFAMAVPLILAMVGFIMVRFVLNRPFHEGFMLYMALAAFNYYYFYCSKLTGRNPTDVGEWGTPATSLEKLQKDIVFFLLLALGVIKLFKSHLEGHPFWSRKLNHPILKLLGLFIGFSLIRGIFWMLEGDSTFDLLFYIRTNIEFAVIPLVLCTTLITKEKHLGKIYKGILYTLPIVAILGIVEFLLHGSPYERSFYGGQVFSRATATLQNPNNLGGYIALAMGVYVIYFFKNQLYKFERWLFWPSMPLGFACLFMTLSRSAMLFFFVMLTACFAIMYFTSRQEMGKERFAVCRNLMVTYILTMGVSIFILYKYFDFSNAVADAVELYVQSSEVSSNRVYAPLVTMGNILSNPLAAFFGYSKSMFVTISDNTFANVLLRNGILGFLIYISMWFYSLIISYRRSLEARRTANYLYMTVFYILGFQFLYGFTAPVNQNFPHNMYIWFTFGTLIWLESKPTQPKQESNHRPPPARLKAVSNEPTSTPNLP